MFSNNADAFLLPRRYLQYASNLHLPWFDTDCLTRAASSSPPALCAIRVSMLSPKLVRFFVLFTRKNNSTIDLRHCLITFEKIMINLCLPRLLGRRLTHFLSEPVSAKLVPDTRIAVSEINRKTSPQSKDLDLRHILCSRMMYIPTRHSRTRVYWSNYQQQRPKSLASAFTVFCVMI